MKNQFPRIRTVAMAAILGALVLTSSAAADLHKDLSDDQQAVEKKTKVGFARVVEAADPLPELALTGVGVRSKMRFKVYACAHYVDAAAELGDDPTGAVIGGDFARRIIMHFVRDVGAEKIANAFRDGFKKNGFDPEGGELEAEIETFLAYFTSDIKKGDVIELTFTPGVGVTTAVLDETKPPIGGAAFASAVWSIWFGEKPVSKGLREDLLELVTGG